MIDLSFRNISRLLDLPFKNSKNEPTRNSYFEYYLPLIEIKVLIYIYINNKTFFDKLVKKANKKHKKNLLKCQEMIPV